VKIRKKPKLSIVRQAEEAYIDKEWATFSMLLKNYPKKILGHRSSDKSSFLHYAVWTRNHRLIEELIKAGADVSAQNGQGYTPLINACAKDDPAAVKILLDANADQKPKDVQGRDALSFAIFSKTVGPLFIKKNKPKKKRLRIRKNG